MSEQEPHAGAFGDGIMGYVEIELLLGDPVQLEEMPPLLLGGPPQMVETVGLRMSATPGGVAVRCGPAHAILHPSDARALARHLFYLADLSIAFGRLGDVPPELKGSDP